MAGSDISPFGQACTHASQWKWVYIPFTLVASPNVSAEPDAFAVQESCSANKVQYLLRVAKSY